MSIVLKTITNNRAMQFDSKQVLMLGDAVCVLIHIEGVHWRKSGKAHNAVERLNMVLISKRNFERKYLHR